MSYLLHSPKVIALHSIVVCIYHLVMISIKWSETAQKNALAGTDIIVTQLLHYRMPLLFVCNHLIVYLRVQDKVQVKVSKRESKKGSKK